MTRNESKHIELIWFNPSGEWGANMYIIQHLTLPSRYFAFFAVISLHFSSLHRAAERIVGISCC